MEIKVQAPFHVNQPLQELIDEKVNKLATLFERITSAEVFLKKEEMRFYFLRNQEMPLEVMVRPLLP